MMWFSGTSIRRPRRPCHACGGAAPLDAIRLRGGRLYCPAGDCRREAEGLIRQVRGRPDAPSFGQEAWDLTEMPGVAFLRDDDPGAGAAVVRESSTREGAVGPILV